MITRILKSVILVVLSAFLFASCVSKNINTVEVTDMKKTYVNITPEQAKEIIDNETGYVILDVRTEEEFSQGHIPGAILIPDYEISEKAESVLTDKNQTLLVYCRSGRRSKLAAQALADLGYTDIREFGGIIDWKYEIEK